MAASPISSRRLADIVVPGAAAAAVLGASLIFSAKKPLWYDEIFSWNLISDSSVSHMLGAMRDGAEAAPPLYHFIARGWAAVFGNGASSLRLLSALCICAAILVLWRLLRSAYGIWASAIEIGRAHV